mmetsp:Transcript_69591/g.123132  ORF Transcript_69591/g.123132 Transcript_69591/m.123132 type:complete len:453 (-) Transcript_69591:38-1396(-)
MLDELVSDASTDIAPDMASRMSSSSDMSPASLSSLLPIEKMDCDNCEAHLVFQRTATKLIRNLGRGWCTPDQASSWESQQVCSSDPDSAQGQLPGLNRGWMTPDPHLPQNELRQEEALRALNKALASDKWRKDQSDNLDLWNSEVSTRDGGSFETPGTPNSDGDTDGDINHRTSNLPDVLEHEESVISGATSSMAWQDPNETIIIVDWDDTILPLSWLQTTPVFQKWHATGGKPDWNEFTADGRQALAEIDNAARSFLLTASSLGRIFCVTLSRRPWQEISMKFFMPLTAQVWEDLNLPVYYATEEGAGRRMAGPKTVKHVLEDDEELATAERDRRAWQKRRAMERCIKHFYRGHSWKNIISIGDGQAEFDAIRDIGFVHTNPISSTRQSSKMLRTKGIMMLDQPACAALTSQLQVLQSWLPSIVSLDDDLSLSMPDQEDEIVTLHQRFADQ